MSGHRRIGRPGPSGASTDLGTGGPRNGSRGINSAGPAARRALRRRLGRRLSDRQLLERFVARRTSRRGRLRRLGSPGTDRWSWASGASSWAIAITPRTPSRPCPGAGPQARTLARARPAGNWLYGVARHGRKSRGRLARLRRRGDGSVGPATAQPAPPAFRAILDREQAEALHREIDRLPGAFRSRSCSATSRALPRRGGASAAMAAARSAAGWPGRGRSSGAGWPSRRRLGPRPRWRRRWRPGPPRRPSRPSCATPRPGPRPPSRPGTPRRGPLGNSPRPWPGVLRTMLLPQAQARRGCPLVLAAVATGIGFLTRSPAMGDERMKTPAGPEAIAAPRTPTGPPVGKAQDPDPGRMTVTGRVLDPQGKPAAACRSTSSGAPRAPGGGNHVRKDAYILLGQGVADGEGRFQIEAKHASSARFHDVYALAGGAGPGSGFGSVKLPADAEQPAAEFRLRPEQVIRGRLVDVSGQPAAGRGPAPRDLRRDSPGRRREFRQPRPRPRLRLSDAHEGLRAWPKAVITDARVGSCSPHRPAASSSRCPSRPPLCTAESSTSRPAIENARKRSRWRCIRRGSSKAACWPATTPAHPAPWISVRRASARGEGWSRPSSAPTTRDVPDQPYAVTTPDACLPPRGQPYLAREEDSRGPRGGQEDHGPHPAPRPC